MNLRNRSVRTSVLLLPVLLVLLLGTVMGGEEPQLLILTAQADQTSETILIQGQNFLGKNKDDSVVTLAGNPLTVQSVSDTEIWTDLPAGVTPGTYLLTVSRGQGSVKNDSFSLTIGAVGPAGPQGDMGPTGATGPAGPMPDMSPYYTKAEVDALIAAITAQLPPGGGCAIFYDNFDDGDADGWSFYPGKASAYGNWRVENGSLVEDSGGDGYIGLVDGLVVSTQSIDVRLRTNYPSGYGGVVLWYQDQSNFLVVRLYPAVHAVWVAAVVDGVAVKEAVLPISNAIGNNTWHELRVDANSVSGEVAVYLNGANLSGYQAETPHRTGRSGVFSGNAGVSYDDFRIVSSGIPSLGCPPPVAH
jgi:hypothetical protein